MGWVRNWLEATACPVLERDQDERVQALAYQMARFMRHEGRFFDLEETAQVMGVPPRDLPFVQDRLYELTLKYVMREYVVTERDRAGLGWVARTLKLTPDQARRIELRVGRHVFEQYLAFAMAGGYLDPEELRQLRSVADSLGVSTRQFMVAYLAESGEKFLEQILSGMAEEGRISDSAWGRLVASTEALGLAESEFLQVLRPHVRKLSERLGEQVRHEGQVEADLRPAMESLLSRINPG